MASRSAQRSTGAGGVFNRRHVLQLGGLAGLAGLGAILASCSDSDSDDSAEAVASPVAAAATSPPTVKTSDEALTRLLAGNARYVAGRPNHADQSAARRTEVAAGQHPYALILSCADSRVPPEVVFDEGLGDLFVVRSAGQVIDDAVLGSIQYAVAELSVPLIFVLGHEKCGAVKATLEAVEKKSPASGTAIDVLVEEIKPAVEEAEKSGESDVLDAAVILNVESIVSGMAGLPVIKPAVQKGTLKIVGGRYDLDTGAVTTVG